MFVGTVPNCFSDPIVSTNWLYSFSKAGKQVSWVTVCWGTILLSFSFFFFWLLDVFWDDLGALLTSFMRCIWHFCILPLAGPYPQSDHLSPLPEDKQNRWHISHMFLDEKGWNRFPVLIMRETCSYTFPMGKARLYIEFLCHMCRHDLSKQQWSLHSVVFWWQNIVYYNDYVLFIWESCLKWKKKKKAMP